jgi:hypothetical protein
MTPLAVPEILLSMERAALDRWMNGDPSGFLEISAPDVVYFDNMIERRLNGLGELAAYYESLRGKIFFDGYELIDPCVQQCGNAVVLTFNFASRKGDLRQLWNCTEVYRRDPAGWRIIQTHWSRSAAR